MATGKSGLYNDLLKERHARLEAIRLDRDRATVLISAAWQKGYTALKDENDRAQKERDNKFRESMAELNAWFLDRKVGLQR